MKPKQLTSEVQRFIDCKYKWKQYHKHPTSEHKDWLSYRDYNETLRAFYNQSFKAEEITELFEGWELAPLRNDSTPNAKMFFVNYIPKTNILILEYDSDEDINNEVRFEFNYTPKTRSDFITLCKLAGITLRWK